MTLSRPNNISSRRRLGDTIDREKAETGAAQVGSSGADLLSASPGDRLCPVTYPGQWPSGGALPLQLPTAGGYVIWCASLSHSWTTTAI